MCVCVGFVMCVFCNVWVCVCVGFVMCGFCNVWVCVCVGFYVHLFLFVTGVGSTATE